MRIVEVREPATALETLEAVSEALNAVVKFVYENPGNLGGHAFEDLKAAYGWVDDVIEGNFIVRGEE
jgi:hypothetical protein